MDILEVWSDLFGITQDVHKIMERLVQVWVWKQGGRVQGIVADELDSGCVLELSLIRGQPNISHLSGGGVFKNSIYSTGESLLGLVPKSVCVSI